MQARHEHCPHFNKSLPREKADETIRKFVILLEQWQKDNTNAHVDINGIFHPDDRFDTFAFSGLSGALIAPVLAHLMNKELLLVRKNVGNDGSASSRWVEGNVGAKRIVVVDDLICTGKTMSNLLGGLKRFAPEARVTGLLLYDHIGMTDLFLPGSAEFSQMERAANTTYNRTELK